MTAQRRLLLGLIQEVGGHLDADELHRLAHERGATVSLSTVYRNLHLFKKLNLVEERHFVEDHHHYEAKASSEHHHLTCLGCGQVLEFQSALSQHLQKDVGRRLGFQVLETEVNMRGYCRRCRSWGRAQEAV